MMMTAEAKEELSRMVSTSAKVRRCEVSSLLRFADGLQVIGGRVSLAAQVDSEGIGRRLSKDIFELYGYPAVLTTLAARGPRNTRPQLVVRVPNASADLGRQTGLVDGRGRTVRGLPAQIVGGSVEEVQAAWRGAFLARGQLTPSARTVAIAVNCPSPEAALALVGAARRLGVKAKAREVGGGDQVLVRGVEPVGVLLNRMGARETAHRCEQSWATCQAWASAPQNTSFIDTNLRRSARAAAATADRVQWALEVLADAVPDHLAVAGKLRVEHREASLEELGRLADPPMTKDGVAGRIRRLIATAERKEARDDARIR